MTVALGDYEVTPTPYPVRSNSSSATIKGADTTATTVYFADKILVTVTQHGRLAHWVHVPLDISATDHSLTTNPYSDQDEDVPNSDLLPMHHLTATTVLGGTIPELEVLGQTLATQIASAIKTRDARETRMVVVGMGLDKSMCAREEFSELVGLVLGVL
ncbi:hypothetical protein K504DRAFT_500609 [Pleomassaria siparia CBS 279.74]|uniref:Uncharacterized protein n=1 Tax=Pleomassaria siparia CBS 279.74 TaxID=1314801 RepID=A0A6G1KCN8_9PLEO|nr:hypothetical protein K504DRAFT_500609 [Pleomassaria siparia CBS 279.74]